MSNRDKQTIVLRGKAMYAKVLGDPVPNYNKDGREWTLDLLLDAKGVKTLKDAGASGKIKQREDRYDNTRYITLKQKELRANGSANKPIKIVDIHGEPWDQEALIGNESVVDVKITVRNFGKGKPIGVYPNAIRVLRHVSYTSASGFEPLSEDDEFFSEEGVEEQTASSFDEDLDDDIPF